MLTEKGKQNHRNDIMKLQTTLLLICLFRTSFALPLQIGILASNSNEILRLNGLTLATLGQAQGSSILPQYVLQQQQPEVLLTPQVVNLNPQLAGPFSPQGPQLFLPNQGNQLTPMLIPNGQQEQLGPPQDPNAPNVPQQAQNPVQMFPHFQYPSFGFPQFPRQQGFPYYMPPYGYPQQRNTVVLQPNNGQQTLERTTQRPQLPLQQASQPKVQTEKTWPLGTQKESTTIPPDPRGDTSGPGIDEGQSNFPFLFEP
ncbi:gamma-gliadin isoform X1 [Micropterus dolomieu]|uniref:gamma-gliadin isoform X1 n=1 Tax=Micropterus dolomieu TaxID=147949 RepID=UPI001E8E40CD|nr:gamma-gliadin isoform X1 [Micropterus dolomieu]